MYYGSLKGVCVLSFKLFGFVSVVVVFFILAQPILKETCARAQLPYFLFGCKHICRKTVETVYLDYY